MSNRKYTPEEKGQAIELAKEIGGTEAARQLKIPEDTVYTWLARAKKGTLQTQSFVKTTEQKTNEVEQLKAEIKNLKAEKRADKARMEQIEKQMQIQEDVIDFFINRQKK